MSDTKIGVDYSDINAAINSLGGMGDKFVATMHKIAREQAYVNKAMKLGADVFVHAVDRMEDAIKDQEKATASKRATQDYTHFWKSAIAEREKDEKDLANFQRQVAAQNAKVQKDRANEYKKWWDSALSSVEQRFARLATTTNKDLSGIINGNLGIGAQKDTHGVDKNNSLLLQQLQQEQVEFEKSAAEAIKYANTVDRLAQKYDPAVFASNKYKKTIEELNMVMGEGGMSISAYLNQMDTLQKEFDAFNSGVYMAGSRFNQFGEQSNFAGKSAQRFGMYAQQAGYQLGDFAVQIQSGQNAGVAFSQQFAQLAGLIPGVAGALTTFAAIGIGLVIQQMTRAKKDASELDEVISSFEDWEDVTEKAASGFERNLVGAINNVRAAYGDLIADLSETKLKAAWEGINDAMQLDSSQVGYIGTGLGFVSPQVNISNQLTNRGMAQSKQLAETLWQQMMSPDGYSDASALSEDFNEYYNTLVNSNQVLDYHLKQIAAVADESGIILRLVEDQIEAEETIAEAKEKAKEASQEAAALQKDISQSYQDQMRDLAHSINLEMIKARWGEDSLTYLNEEKRQRLEVSRIELARQGLDQQRINNLIAAEGVLIDQEQAEARRIALQKQGITLLTQSKSLMQSISRINLSRVFDNAARSARGLFAEIVANSTALSAMSGFLEETKYAQMEADLVSGGKTPQQAATDVEVQRAIDSDEALRNNPNRDNIQQMMLEAARRRDEALNNLDSNTEAWKDANDPDKGSKSNKDSNSDKDKETALDRIKKEIEQQTKLNELRGDARRLQEEIYNIEDSLGDERKKISDDQIEQLARTKISLEAARQAEEDRTAAIEAATDRIEDALTNSLMTFVEGTADMLAGAVDFKDGVRGMRDAVKDIMRKLILDMYQDNVAKGASSWAVKGLTGLLGGLGGGSKASIKATPFAVGGIVDSPTMFGYGGNKTGLMGESGPEAILPLRRGSNGKLGVEMSGGQGSGSVVIQQHFHIAANGDETVRAIVRQESPRIAEQAKAAVLDARSRGKKGF